ncbi:HlyD family secretion protein [Solimonas sp. SE-A11]|uniref:HlyD family secretion protein n=1 Tax=Solimonas sp. SE-A11 TaxID=3054954 RepID=UPI00259CA063|nr:HlyD family secretion protein [Solimonas sp. SE-A11]MDM4768682.1 HlyD family secretion protein [Solimonas sp. SE-A11]
MTAEKRQGLRLIILGTLLVGAIALGARWWFHGRFFESTDNAYVRADITAITPRISGEIVEVAVRNNQTVRKGDLLARIDPRDYEAKLENARAAVAVREAALKANVEQKSFQAAMIREAEANAVAAGADRQRLEKDWQRADRLVKEGVANQARLDTASAAYKSGSAQVERAQAGVAAARQQSATLDADRARQQAELEAARAMLKLAEIDFAATELRAPVDGVVGDLAARVGERVNAGLRLLSLVPLQAVFVEANFKETQLTGMRVGQTAEIKVDAFPDKPLTARIDSVSPASGAEFALLPPDNATGNFNKIVQRVPVKLVFDNAGELAGLLRPGMSVEVSVDTRTAAAQ